MFGLGMGEVLIILVLALLLLGPQKLPEAAKQFGKGLRDFRRATEDLKHQFESELYAVEASAKAKPKLVRRDGTSGPGAAAPGGASTGTTAAGAAAGVEPSPLGDADAPLASSSNVPGLEAARLEEEPHPAAAPEPARVPATAAPAASPSLPPPAAPDAR